MKCSSGHSNRALNNLYLIRSSLDICFLIFLCRVTFLCDDKPGSYLNAICSQRNRMSDILRCEDTSSHDHRYLLLKSHCKTTHSLYNLSDSCIIINCIYIVKFFSGKSKMTTRFGSLDYNKICGTMIFLLPAL